MESEILYRSFEVIYKQFAQGLFRFIYFKVSDYELTQDLTEDTFVRYWQVLIKGVNIENHKAFLYRIAKGKVFDYYRKKGKSRRIGLEKIDERLLGVIDTVEDSISLKQEVEQIYIRMKKLKKEFQDVILLHYVEDLEIKEIAFVLNKQENAVRVLLHRGLRSLRKIV